LRIAGRGPNNSSLLPPLAALVVFTMVGYPSEVEELYLAGDGLLACTKPGAVLIDLTTSSPELARDIAEAAQVSGRMAFDCPVTGGESGAIAGTLTAIVGATENDIAPVRDILATFAANICCFDGAGKGHANVQRDGTSEHVEWPQRSQQRDRCAGYAQREARPRVLNALLCEMLCVVTHQYRTP